MMQKTNLTVNVLAEVSFTSFEMQTDADVSKKKEYNTKIYRKTELLWNQKNSLLYFFIFYPYLTHF